MQRGRIVPTQKEELLNKLEYVYGVLKSGHTLDIKPPTLGGVGAITRKINELRQKIRMLEQE